MLLPAGMRSIGVQVSLKVVEGEYDDEEDGTDDYKRRRSQNEEHENKKLAATLKQELLRKNGQVAQMQSQLASLQAYVERANAAKTKIEMELYETDLKLKECLQGLSLGAPTSARDVCRCLRTSIIWQICRHVAQRCACACVHLCAHASELAQSSHL
jgi:hypothetical protein